MDSSSSDSEADERVRNVHSLLVKSHESQRGNDENYEYKRKLGELIFDAYFEGGNLGFVERVDQFNYDMFVRPDVANPRHRLWFNFTVSNHKPNQCVIFTFVNFSETLALFFEGMTPVVRSRMNPNWLHLHQDQVFYYKSAEHGNRLVLSVAFRFSAYDDEHQFSLFYPYNYTMLTSFINRWNIEMKRISTRKRSESLINRCQSPESSIYVRSDKVDHRDEFRSRSSIGFRKSTSKLTEEDFDFVTTSFGKSILSKSVYLLSVKSRTNSVRPKVIVLCRSSGNLDGAASWICQGLLDYVLSDRTIAVVARQHMDLYLFPMIDPDSICAGNSHTDILGQSPVSDNLLSNNRFLHSNLVKIRSFLVKICSKNNRVILIEIKVAMNLIGTKIVGSYYKDSLRMERHLSFPKTLSRFTNDFYLENCEFLKKISRGSLFDFTRESSVDQYRLEVSPFASYKRSLTELTYQEYDQKKYLQFGKAMVYSLLDLLRPKDRNLPHCVNDVLDSFHQRADDVDHLLLNIRGERHQG